MPENPSRFAAAFYDQFEDERQIADWGGDELFTRMPRPRAVDDAPPPRFRRSLTLVDPPEDRRGAAAAESTRSPDRGAPATDESPRSCDRGALATDESPRPRDRRPPRSGEQAMRERAERIGLSVIDGTPTPEPESGVPAGRFDESGSMIEPAATERRTKVITGHPGGAPRPRPLPAVPARRRPVRSAAEWIGPQPERIVGWAFALGLLLILIAVLTG